MAKKTLVGESIEIYEDQILGTGGSSVVKLCKLLASGKMYACKIILKNRIATEEERACVVREVLIGTRLSCQPHIVACEAFFEDDYKIYMLMELCSGGSLEDYINERGRVNEDEARFLFGQIVEGMELCHYHNIIHGDLETKNILLGGQKGLDVKVTDFGHSKFMDCTDTFSRYEGSQGYEEERYGAEADVWNAGRILFEMLSGQCLSLYALKLGGLLQRSNVSDEAKDLVSCMLHTDPEQRPAFSQILGHPWFTKFCSTSF